MIDRTPRSGVQQISSTGMLIAFEGFVLALVAYHAMTRRVA
jgi:hypothetical protein